MERHLRSRRARSRLGLAAACLCAAGGCVPIAPFEKPADAAGGQTRSSAESALAPSPDLPEPGDRPAAAPAEPSETVAAPVAGPVVPVVPVAEEPQAEPLPVDDPEQSKVRLQLESFYKAYDAREWKQARAHFWEGATITDVRMLPDQTQPAVQVSSATEFFEELERTSEAGPEGFEGRLVGVPEVRTTSNVAQAWCHFQASFGGPQESMSWRRVDAFTFVLHEGQWKISSLALSKSFDAPVER